MHTLSTTNTVHPIADGHNRPPLWCGIEIRDCRFCGSVYTEEECCSNCGPRRARPRSILDSPNWQLAEGMSFAARPLRAELVA